MTDQKTTISVTGRDKTKAALNSVKGNLQKTNREAQGLAARFRSVARATVIMEGPLGGTAGRLSAVATIMNSVNAGTVALGVGIAGMTAAVYQSMTRFSEFEKQTFKIDALLQQTGYSSGQTADSIEEMSQRIARATLESTNGMREAAGVLLSFRSVAGSAFERTLEVASDLSAITGQDLKSSVIQLGKALEDPMTGMTALRRSGVSFTNSQKDMIVAMKDAGDTAGAQAAVLGLLEGQLGGAGAGQSRGLAGAVDSLSQSWDNLLTNMATTGAGQAATEFLNKMASGLQNIANLAKDNDPHEEFNELLNKRADILEEINRLEDGLEDRPPWVKWRVDDLKDEADELKGLMIIETEKMRLKSQSAADAHSKSLQAQRDIAAQNQAEITAAETKKRLIQEQKQLEKDITSAEQYGQKLLDENQKLQDSLLTKSQLEDEYHARRLEKIQTNFESGFITQDEYYRQEQTAFQIHHQTLTNLAIEEGEKRVAAEQRIAQLSQSVANEWLNFGNAVARKSKTLQQTMLLVSGMVGAARTVADSYVEAGKIMRELPLIGEPLAAKAIAYGKIRAGLILATSAVNISGARRYGGTVIGGRSYMVGENGPEVFTASRTGNIINNNTINNMNDSPGRTVNLTITTIDPTTVADMFTSNRQLLYNTIVDAMNEEGVSFS